MDIQLKGLADGLTGAFEEESSQYRDLGFCLSKLAVLFIEIKKGEEMDGDRVKSRFWVWPCEILDNLWQASDAPPAPLSRGAPCPTSGSATRK